MKVIARFMLSAAAEAHFPPATAPEVAFLGRSNVGKSSLLNSLIGDKLARVSNTPGRTQTINFYALNFGKPESEPELVFADLPGYGYARVPKAIVGEWPKFIEPYLGERDNLALCVVLIDSNIPPQKSDRQLLSWLKDSDREFIVVATKADRISGNRLTQSLGALRKELGVEVLPYSAKTGDGKEALWKRIRAAQG
ncbi:MAG: ribosome biogenesis GTP-binding protein YihA/YsxC [Terriglobales bacterium]